MTQVAAQLYTLRDVMKTPADIGRGFERLASDGWKAVQASGIGPIAPGELRRLADANGLAVCATHNSFERLQNDLDGVLEEHGILGCGYIGIGGLPREFARDAEGYRRFAALVTPIAERIRRAGRTFVYHNHNFELARFGALTGLDILLNECGDAVQFEPDTYWLQAGGGDVVAWLGRMAGRIDVVHFKDMMYDIGEGQAAMAEVGEGNLDWPRIISACRAGGTRWHVVEQDVCRRDPFDSLKLSLENLRRFGLE